MAGLLNMIRAVGIELVLKRTPSVAITCVPPATGLNTCTVRCDSEQPSPSSSGTPRYLPTINQTP